MNILKIRWFIQKIASINEENLNFGNENLLKIKLLILFLKHFWMKMKEKIKIEIY